MTTLPALAQSDADRAGCHHDDTRVPVSAAVINAADAAYKSGAMSEQTFTDYAQDVVELLLGLSEGDDVVGFCHAMLDLRVKYRF